MILPGVRQVGGVTVAQDPRGFGVSMLLWLLAGACIGGVLPTHLAAGPPGISGRLAIAVGAVCGAYIGARAVWLWTVLMLAGFALWVVAWILGIRLS